MITRDEALKFINEKVANKNIIKHMLATEALMRALAREFSIQPCLPAGRHSELKINEDEWAMAGLIHDGDYCEDVPPQKQGVQIIEWLRQAGHEIPEGVAHATAAHNSMTGVAPVTPMDWAIFCGDSLTGLIVAAALVLPSKKLADLTPESVLKRFKERSFAKGTRREDIALCEEKLAIPLTKFVAIGLAAMQAISSDLGL